MGIRTLQPTRCRRRLREFGCEDRLGYMSESFNSNSTAIPLGPHTSSTRIGRTHCSLDFPTMASQIRQRVEMLKINQEAVSAHGNVYEYVSVKINCLSSYHTAHDFEKGVKECTDYLAEWPRTRLLEQLQREGGDPDATLEAAHRYVFPV